MDPLYFGYAKQITVLMLSEETMTDWFAEKKGYDGNICRIVEEGSGENGKNFNCIYR